MKTFHGLSQVVSGPSASGEAQRDVAPHFVVDRTLGRLALAQALDGGIEAFRLLEPQASLPLHVHHRRRR